MQQIIDAIVDSLSFTIPIKIKALYAMQIFIYLFFPFNV